MSSRSLLLTVSLATLLGAANAQADAQPQAITVTESSMPGSPKPLVVPQALAAPVDTRKVWDFLHAHDYPHASEALTQLRQQNPQWTPPADLQNTLDQEEINYARDQKKPDVVRIVAGTHPSLFSCPSVYNLWTLAQADFALHIPADGEAVYQRIVNECDEKAILTTLDQASGTLARDAFTKLLAQAAPHITSPEGKTHLEQLRQPHQSGVDVTPVTAALARGDAAGADALLAPLSPQITQTRNAGAATQLGWAYYKAHRPATAQQWFTKALSWHPSSNPLNGALLAAASAKHWQDLDTLATKYPKLIPPASRKVLADAYASASADAAEDGSYPLARSYAEQASLYGNDNAWAPLGWALLNAKQPDAALDVFSHTPDNESARNGKAFALQDTGKLQEAEHLACGDPAPVLESCGDILSELADKAYKAGQWPQVHHWAEVAAQMHVAARGLRMENAWSYMREEHYDQAGALFTALYQEKPDNESAEGVITALRAEGQMDDARIAAGEQGGPLAQSYSRAVADVDYGRKQFIGAQDAAPSAYPQLAGIDGPDVGAGVSVRDREGSAGMDRVQALGTYVEGGQALGDNWLGARVDNSDYRIGMPAQGAAIGSVTGTWKHSPTSSSDVTTPTITFRHEDDVSYAAEIGTTPIGGEVSARPSGLASVTLRGGDSAITAMGFSEPNLDSLLSASGMTDPVSGAHWGRVVESGGKLQGYVGLGDGWSLSGQGLVSALDGDNVASNSRVALATGLNYTFKPDGFDYLRVGPNYFWESYDKDLSHFTLGQGGYYSPGQLNLPYASLEFLTAEAQRFQLWGQFNLGWNEQQERSSYYFPLSNSGPEFAGSQSDGLSTYAALRASYLLTDHVSVDAFAWDSNAPSYHEATVGLGFTYHFDSRSDTMSSDLPQHYGQPRF